MTKEPKTGMDAESLITRMLFAYYNEEGGFEQCMKAALAASGLLDEIGRLNRELDRRDRLLAEWLAAAKQAGFYGQDIKPTR